MIKNCNDIKKNIYEFIQLNKEFQIPINNSTSSKILNSKISQDIQERYKKFGQTYFDFKESEILKNNKKIRTLVDSQTSQKKFDKFIEKT